MASLSIPKLLLIGFILVCVVWALLLIPTAKEASLASIQNFEQCVAAGFSIDVGTQVGGAPSESCTTSDGRTFDKIEVNALPQFEQYQDSTSGCVQAGNDGELCVENAWLSSNPSSSIKNENTCFRSAMCTRQLNGHCGWTQMAVLLSCLNPKSPDSEQQ